jgi:hypothetical protein
MKRKPEMIGAHVPKQPQTRRTMPHLYVSGKLFNAAFDAWQRKRTGAPMVRRDFKD